MLLIRRLAQALVAIIFLINGLPCPSAVAADLELPVLGTMVNLSPAFEPVLIKGLRVHPRNPFLLDFIVDTGNDTQALVDNAYLEKQSNTLIKYFLAAMTIPEKDLWVNLSPYEKDRMIATNLGQTVMGKDMLAQDYILKQLTASLIYPERNLGKRFWDKVYSKAQQMYGTTEIPINTFNKVWIVADRADIYEKNETAYIVGAHLKVMLEEDYLAKKKHTNTSAASVSSQVVRSIILPEIEHEVNTGKNFSLLRQMFYSMVLASWYKMTLKDALLTQVYANQSKVKVGVNQKDPRVNTEIFERYLKAYKKGVFNYIKEDVDQAGSQPIPRKYFSGGLEMRLRQAIHIETTGSATTTGSAMEILAEATPVMFLTSPAMSARQLATVIKSGLGPLFSYPRRDPPKIKLVPNKLVAVQVTDYLLKNGAIPFNQLGEILKFKPSDKRTQSKGKVKIITLLDGKSTVLNFNQHFSDILAEAASKDMPATKDFIQYDFAPIFGQEVGKRFEAEEVVRQGLKSKDPLTQAYAYSIAETLRASTNATVEYFNTDINVASLLIGINRSVDINVAKASILASGTIIRFKKNSPSINKQTITVAQNILADGLRSSSQPIFECALSQYLLAHPHLTLSEIVGSQELNLNRDAFEKMVNNPSDEIASMVNQNPIRYSRYPNLIDNAKNKLDTVVNTIVTDLNDSNLSVESLYPATQWRTQKQGLWQLILNRTKIRAVRNFRKIQLRKNKQPLAAYLLLIQVLFDPDEYSQTKNPSNFHSMYLANPVSTSFAMTGINPKKKILPDGGIDLNNSQMSMNVHKDAAMGGVQIKFDAATLERIKRNIGMVFKIESIEPISNLPLVFENSVPS